MKVHHHNGTNIVCKIDRSKRWGCKVITSTLGREKVTCKNCVRALKGAEQ